MVEMLRAFDHGRGEPIEDRNQVVYLHTVEVELKGKEYDENLKLVQQEEVERSQQSVQNN
jgi:hypothetical protein